MKIAILSDTREPTRMNYPGHGLGRSIARIADGLAARGHDVMLYAGLTSSVAGCQMVEDAHEGQRAYRLAAGGMERFDAILDGSHHFGLAHLRDDLPIVCKVADDEGHAPRNRIYGGGRLAEYFRMTEPGVVIQEGVDVDSIPFAPSGRNNHLLHAARLHPRKKPEVALEIAHRAGLPIWFMGNGAPYDLPADKQMGPKSGAEFYAELASARGMIQPVPSMALLEAAATGTPGIIMVAGDDWVVDGITGFICETVEAAVEAVGWLDGLDKWVMRKWVADNRSIEQMCASYERVLQRAADGERW